VDAQRVLTCAHNLYQAQFGGYAKVVIFTLAQNGNANPYNPVAAANIRVSEEYETLSPPDPNYQGNVADYTQYVFDFGLVRLQVNLDPASGVFPGMVTASDTDLSNRHCDIGGYPSDKLAGTMWNGAGNLLPSDDTFLFYRISTYKGQSGSAVRSLFPDGPVPSVPRIVGIHVAGSPALNANFAVRLTQDVVDKIYSWM
jgi:glutamyl endopeptidase